MSRRLDARQHSRYQALPKAKISDFQLKATFVHRVISKIETVAKVKSPAISQLFNSSVILQSLLQILQ